ncbi:MAG: exosortase/archaeosortase family protein [Chloroflexi bacterium]|nr:exosortase/archaeosortase family protein [Chloroflexota bacterium]
MEHTHSLPRPEHRLAALIFAVTAFVFLPTWAWLAEAWWTDAYYSHGPLVLLIGLYFIWARRRVLISDRGAPNSLGYLLLAASLGLHLWATVWRAYYISALTIPFVFFGLTLGLYGWPTARTLLFPLGFLFFMVPLPLAESVGPVLEAWTASTATAFAQGIGVAAQNIGSEVYLPNSTFTVGIPCGGLNSVIAITTLVVLWAYVTRGGALGRGLVLLAAVPIALAANTVRIALLFGIASAWGAQAGMDYFHSWSSPVLFLVAFAILLALARLLGCSEVRWEAVLPS